MWFCWKVNKFFSVDEIDVGSDLVYDWIWTI